MNIERPCGNTVCAFHFGEKGSCIFLYFKEKERGPKSYVERSMLWKKANFEKSL